ncbi:hypothetical protein AGLY_015658 [Aphis glycines]|uniref:Uncharacterized protein n=1 Tax=Aphis glycines TaxID=307491 RepID=A0A6G0T261_APHGL|nr:hypothetical protein AGLY_015658 [Aphis glycines]
MRYENCSSYSCLGCFSTRGVEVLGHDHGKERSERRRRNAVRRIEDGRRLARPSATGAPRPAVRQPAADVGAHRTPSPTPSPAATPPPPPPPPHHQPVVQQLNQQPPLHHTRSGSSLSVTADYRGAAVEPPPSVIVLEPGAGGGGGGSGGGGRRATVNGSVSGGGGVICGGAHQPHAAVWHPRPIYPFPLPLPSPGALWHHAQPHFSTPGFPPFIEVSAHR